MFKYLVDAGGNKFVYLANGPEDALDQFFEEHPRYSGPWEVTCIGR